MVQNIINKNRVTSLLLFKEKYIFAGQENGLLQVFYWIILHNLFFSLDLGY